MNLHDTLTQVVPEINIHLEAINHGGCGWFAHSLSTILAEQDIASDIVLVRWSRYQASHVSNMITKLGGEDINDSYRRLFTGQFKGYCDPCFGHIGVRINDTVYDCDGVLAKLVISEPIEADVMKLALDNGKAWNPTFLDCNSGIGNGAVYTMRDFLSQALAGVIA